MQHNRNFDRIANEKARKVVDPVINDLHDELEDAYYKHWKLGKSYDFHGYDKKATVEESKAQFDLLHGMVFRLHDNLIHAQNMSYPENERYPTEKYNDIFDDEGVKIGERSIESLNRLKQQTPHFVNMKNALKSKTQDVDIKSKIDGIK